MVVMKKPTTKISYTAVCFYHSNCHDGATAAWIASDYYGSEILTIPVGHKQLTKRNISMTKGRVIYVVDTTQKPEDLEAINAVAKSLVVLDHHDTSIEPYKDLPYATVDATRCGSMMMWDYLHPGVKAPEIVDYVDDFDRWINKLPDTKAMQMHLRTCKDPSTVSFLNARMKVSRTSLIKDGYKKLKAFEKEIKTAMKGAKVVDLDGHEFVAARARGNRTELGNRLTDEYGIPAVVWWKHSTGDYTFSLRSAKGGVDVAAIAESFGGGGHCTAAGIKTRGQILSIDGKPLPDPKYSYAKSGYYSQTSGDDWKWRASTSNYHRQQSFAALEQEYDALLMREKEEEVDRKIRQRKSRKVSNTSAKKSANTQFYPCPKCNRFMRKGSGNWGLQKHSCQAKGGPRRVEVTARDDDWDIEPDEDGNLICVKYVDGVRVKV